MSTWSQIFPPAPTFTPTHLPSLRGRVFLVTGAASGIGRELSGMLYRAGGRVYMAGRDEQKMRAAMASIRAEQPPQPTSTSPRENAEAARTENAEAARTENAEETQKENTGESKTENARGSMHFLSIDLSDLRTIKPAAQAFARTEPRLDVLFNNAGVSSPPAGSRTAQGFELQMGTNALGPFLLARLLMPCLRAGRGGHARPRVVWVGSQAMELLAPKGGMEFRKVEGVEARRVEGVEGVEARRVEGVEGVQARTVEGEKDDMQSGKAEADKASAELPLWEPVVHNNPTKDYSASKTANFFLAAELARRERLRHGTTGSTGPVVSVALNPGAIRTDILRYKWWVLRMLVEPLLYTAWYGACTLLYAGFADEVLEAADRLGGSCYVVPFGRVHPGLRRGLVEAVGQEAGDGEDTRARRLWEWCERCTEEFA